MATQALTFLSNLIPPTQDTDLQTWANEAGLFGLIRNWKDVCRELGIDCAETQSGIVAVQRAIAREKKKAGKSFDTSMVDDEIPVSKPVSKPLVSGNDPLAVMIAQMIGPHLDLKFEQVLDEEKIIALIDSKLNGLYKGIELKTPTETKQIEGLFHEVFEEVLAEANDRNHVYLYGPAGTGKSTIGGQVAEALGLDFYPVSVCGQTTQSDLVGFINANGQYVSKIFREAYEKGGVFLLDEIDNGNPNVLAVLNNALANGLMAFPDGLVKRHKDFICIAAANTFGTGATEQFVGRNAIDAATLDRFQKVFVGYDMKVEKALYGESCNPVWKARTELTGQTGWVLSTRSIARFHKAKARLGERKAWEKLLANLAPSHASKINSIVE